MDEEQKVFQLHATMRDIERNIERLIKKGHTIQHVSLAGSKETSWGGEQFAVVVIYI